MDTDNYPGSTDTDECVLAQLLSRIQLFKTAKWKEIWLFVDS